MDIKIEVSQEFINGVAGNKRFSLAISQRLSGANFACLVNLSENTIKELIPRLTQELENALAIANKNP